MKRQKNNNKSLIDKDSIEAVVNQCSEIEKDYLEMYEEKEDNFRYRR